MGISGWWWNPSSLSPQGFGAGFRNTEFQHGMGCACPEPHNRNPVSIPSPAFYNWSTDILISSASPFTFYLDSRWDTQSTGIHYLTGGVPITDIRIELLSLVTRSCCWNHLLWQSRAWKGWDCQLPILLQVPATPCSPSGFSRGFRCAGKWGLSWGCVQGMLGEIAAPFSPTLALPGAALKDRTGIIHRKQRINSSWTTKPSLGLWSLSGTCQDFNSLFKRKPWPRAGRFLPPSHWRSRISRGKGFATKPSESIPLLPHPASQWHPHNTQQFPPHRLVWVYLRVWSRKGNQVRKSVFPSLVPNAYSSHNKWNLW